MLMFSIRNNPFSFMVYFFISLVFSCLTKILFSRFLQFKVNFARGPNTQNVLAENH